MSKPTVLIFSTAYFPLVGGAEVAVKEITDRMKQYEFHIITCRMNRDYPKRERMYNARIYRVGWGYPRLDKIYLALFGYRPALKLHCRYDYCLVWSVMASFSGFAALTFKEKTGVNFLLTLQEGDPIEQIMKKTRWVKKRFKRIFMKADALQAISSYLLGWGVDMGFEAQKLKQVVPNGVNISRFVCPSPEARKKARRELRERFNLKEDAKVVITVSRLVKKNGVGDLLESMKGLPSECILLIAGTGELQACLKSKAAELDLSDRVHFLGLLGHEELPRYLWGSDVFCRPSISEGLGNVFLEAMAARIPVVGTLAGGIADFLRDCKTGFVCEARDPENIAGVISTVLDLDPEKRARVLDRAFALVKAKYTWDDIAKDMNNIFKNLCES